jgi:hypothetical protein
MFHRAVLGIDMQDDCTNHEYPFKKVPGRFLQLPGWGSYQMEEDRNMKKLAYVLAAVATVAVGAPTIASAAEFGFSVGGDHDYYRDRDYRGPRAEIYRHDRGLHRGWYHHDRDYYGDRGVVIRRGYGDNY